MVERIASGEFARISGSRGANLAWFLGAGASADAGIPTGYDMILDFKARLFCEATEIPLREVDTGDPIWIERLTRYFDSANGLPAAGSPEEYAIAFEKVYPDERDRRKYIEERVAEGRPSFAHRVLAALIATRRLPAVFQTNFDSLVDDATVVQLDAVTSDDRPNLTISALDSADRAERCLRENAWPLLAKLHGDYQSTSLRNTTEELRQQDERLRRVLIAAIARFGLVVVGYSGRDASIIEALRAGCDESIPYPSGLFWVVRPRSTVLPAVEQLLEHAAERGVEARLVESENFVELAGAVERQISFPEFADSLLKASRLTPRVSPVSVPTSSGTRFPVLRTSALPVLSLPTTARRIRIREPKTTRELQTLLRERQRRPFAVAGRGAEVVAFGSDTDLLAGLEPLDPRVDGTVDLHPESESWALGLLYEALVKGLAWNRPLRTSLSETRGHELRLHAPENDRRDPTALRDRDALAALRVAYGNDERLLGTVPRINRAFAESIRVRLDYHLERWWCVFEPFTWVDLPRESDDPAAEAERRSLRTEAGDWRRERWARKYNSRWDALLQGWSKLLAPERPTLIRFPGSNAEPGVYAEFELWAATAWSSPLSAERAS